MHTVHHNISTNISHIIHKHIHWIPTGYFLSLTETEPTNQEQWNNKANEKLKNITIHI